MPLFLERNDITNMEVDAVVLPTNPWLEEGPGTSRAVFKAAGASRLEAACQRIGHIDYGQAVITSGFDLPAKYIIHAAVPLYSKEDASAEAQLRSCYLESLKTASRSGLTSIAFPLLSSGRLRWPKDDAIRIATAAIEDFIREAKVESDGHDLIADMATEPADMSVYLLMYDEEATEAAQKLYGEIKQYIDDNYVEDKGELLAEYPDYSDFVYGTTKVEETAELEIMPVASVAMQAAETKQLEEKPAKARFSFSSFFGHKMNTAAAVPVATASEELQEDRLESEEESIEDVIEKQEKVESFNDALIRMMNESGLKNAEIYFRANLSKQHFSKIVSDKVLPKKSTILALAIALRLDMEAVDYLLMKAGYALSDSSIMDLIVSYAIKHEIYDIFVVNDILFKYNQKLLGSSIA
ncbi:MAG: macro domain-containing protein [Firmicutes bacterium]|nr:macro domain-containing protein [Bacillota bacterium]